MTNHKDTNAMISRFDRMGISVPKKELSAFSKDGTKSVPELKVHSLVGGSLAKRDQLLKPVRSSGLPSIPDDIVPPGSVNNKSLTSTNDVARSATSGMINTDVENALIKSTSAAAKPREASKRVSFQSPGVELSRNATGVVDDQVDSSSSDTQTWNPHDYQLDSIDVESSISKVPLTWAQKIARLKAYLPVIPVDDATVAKIPRPKDTNTNKDSSKPKKAVPDSLAAMSEMTMPDSLDEDASVCQESPVHKNLPQNAQRAKKLVEIGNSLNGKPQKLPDEYTELLEYYSDWWDSLPEVVAESVISLDDADYAQLVSAAKGFVWDCF